MSSVNKVILLGRLGKDPESRMVADKQVTNFNLATSERYMDKRTGEKKEITEWTLCVAWGSPAEIIQKYVKKGDLLYVEGKLKTRSWEKDGITRYVTEVVVNTVQLMPNNRQEPSQGGSSAYTPPPTTEADPWAPTSSPTNDVPF